MIEEKNSKGEIILNTNFGNGYAITQRGDRFIVMDIIGNEFEFNKFENVCRFVTSAPKWTTLRDEVYNELKSMD